MTLEKDDLLKIFGCNNITNFKRDLKMEMFYYPVENGMLEPVNHMQARSLLAIKLKQRDEGEDTPFSIWSSRNVNCTKFACIEDLDEWVSYISSIEGPLQVASKLKAF